MIGSRRTNALVCLPCVMAVATVVLLVPTQPILAQEQRATSAFGPTRPCSICHDGTPIPLPGKKLPDDGIRLGDCATLASAASILHEDSPFCQSTKALATYCGCPVPPTACTLCQDKSTVVKEAVYRKLKDYPVGQFGFEAIPGTRFLNCGTLENLLHKLDENDERCLMSQISAGEECGCFESPDRGTDDTLNSSDSTITTLETVGTTPCNVCAAGERIPFPDTALDLGDLPVQNCAELDAFTTLVTSDSLECRELQSLGPLCGCTVNSDACSVCPNGEPVPKPSQAINWFADESAANSVIFASIGDSLTCAMLEATMKLPGDLFSLNPEATCRAVQFKSQLCGCSVNWRQFILTWSYRVSGVLSLLGSLLVLFDTLRRRTQTFQTFTTYNQFALGMSCFDVVSSTAYSLTSIMSPVQSGVYQSYGSNTTCALQGFMIQWGFTSMFYSVLLSFYFYLMVCASWKDNDFKKYARRAHVVVITLGSTLALGGISHYGTQLAPCSPMVLPSTGSRVPMTILYAIPASLSALSICILTTRARHHIHVQEQKSKRSFQQWTGSEMKIDPDVKLRKKLWRQSFWYMMAFCATLPVLMLSYFWEFASIDPYWVWVIVAILAPTQGLLNSLVYFWCREGKFECASWELRQSQHSCSLSERISAVPDVKKDHTVTFETASTGSAPLTKDDEASEEQEEDDEFEDVALINFFPLESEPDGLMKDDGGDSTHDLRSSVFKFYEWHSSGRNVTSLSGQTSKRDRQLQEENEPTSFSTTRIYI